MYLIIDIGNSRVKYFFDTSVFYSFEDLKKALPASLSELSILLISSKPELNNLVLEDIQSLDIKIKQTRIFSTQHAKIASLYPTIGADRVANIWAAGKLYPHHNIALIDFGTATTLTTITPDKEFVGGFIDLGFETKLSALAEKTSQLPDLQRLLDRELENQALLVNTQRLAQTTEEAILLGAYQAQLSLIEGWLNIAKQEFSKHNDAPVICLAVSNLAKLFEDQFDEFLPADKIYKAMADALLPKATEATS